MCKAKIERIAKNITMTGDNYNRVMKKWDALAKPIDGLGELEQLVARIGAIQRTENPRIDRRTLLVFLADNGYRTSRGYRHVR